MRKNTPESDSGANESVQLLVSTDRKLQVTGRDSLYLKVLRSVTRKFQDFGGEVFENGSHVDSSYEKMSIALAIALSEENRYKMINGEGIPQQRNFYPSETGIVHLEKCSL